MSQLEQTIKAFHLIQSTSGKNDKISLIKQHETNSVFIESLKFLLDSNITTGIAKKKYDKLHISPLTKWEHGDAVDTEFLNLLNYIKEHNSGRDQDIIMVKSFCYDLSDEIKEFTAGLITKSIKLGVDYKSANKAIPGLIQGFEVMLGTSIDKVKLKGTEQIFLSRKLNGSRCAFVGDKLMTRQGKVYTGCEHIIEELKAIGLQDYFVDGELLYKNEEGLSDSDAFQKGVGIAMSKEESKTDLKFVIFDIFPLTEFWNGVSKDKYSTRRQHLLSLQDKLNSCSHLELVPMVYSGKDHKEIQNWLDYAETHDWEGIMINLDTPYECKRVKSLIKVKKFYTCDLLCIGLKEGEGKNKGSLGSLICDYKGYHVGVGSKLTDEQRNAIWQNPESVVGKIVEVSYKEETKNKDGGISIQFATFVCVRNDKTEPSYN